VLEPSPRWVEGPAQTLPSSLRHGIGETGMQRATPIRVSSAGMARACRIDAVFDINGAAALQGAPRGCHDFDRTIFAAIAIQGPDDPPRVFAVGDGVHLKKPAFGHKLSGLLAD